ncbi:MAG: 3-oxoacid CoA-transferase subunit A [Defluviitaleaceae bacterium]|nr:3-oxoacid CoA-transferase subunit A [Defluviitaleaceae bacterium]MCL2836991.1 3-oxoacid CoA-transferase subunit A [Defluviitaleaceae bacterium]
MAEFVTPAEAARLITEGASLMVGGFMGCGTGHRVIAELARLGTGGLTLICNDASKPGGPDGSDFYGVAKLIHNRQVKKLIASHVGLNPEVAQLMNEGAIEVTLIPQGSMAEMIRAGGAGLGGVLTPTGLGTIVEDAAHVHSVVEVDGRKYLLERSLRADFAVICGYYVDKAGNVWYKGTTRNFNPVMAMAADVVIAETEHVVEIGAIEPENVVTQGILVNYVAFDGGAL